MVLNRGCRYFANLDIAIAIMVADCNYGCVLQFSTYFQPAIPFVCISLI
jgi:hypothetical protein